MLVPPTKDIVIKSLASGGPLKKEIANIKLMGSQESIQWSRSAENLTITLPKSIPEALVTGFAIELK